MPFAGIDVGSLTAQAVLINDGRTSLLPMSVIQDDVDSFIKNVVVARRLEKKKVRRKVPKEDV